MALIQNHFKNTWEPKHLLQNQKNLPNAVVNMTTVKGTKCSDGVTAFS